MKVLKLMLLALPVVMLISCGGSGNEKIEGDWNLSGFSEDGAAVELTECDLQTVWHFTKEPAERLGDGTAVQILKAEAPADCKFFGFDAKWTVKDGQVFISTSRIGGIGGISLAGLMDIVESTPNKLVLKSRSRELTFQR